MIGNKFLSVTGGEPPDAQFNYVTMLLHGDGTNGAQNNTFLDSSTNNFTVTRNGNTTQGSFSPYGPNWSNYFNDSNTYLDLASNAAFAFGTGDFTVEMWLYHVSNGAQRIIGNYTSSGGTEYDIEFAADGTVYFGSYNTYTQTSTAVSLNTWTHVAWVRSSGVETFYINGVSAGSATRSINFSSTNGPRIAGSKDLTVNLYAGYISNLRIVKGTAVYTSTFTPSTTPLTAISGTSLLTCQSNRYIDNSSNAFAITVSGTPSVQRFNPFGASTAYSTATIGGSGYFDGTGDYLSLATNAAMNVNTGNFTFECWVYLATGYSSDMTLLTGGGPVGVTNTMNIRIVSDSIRLGTLGASWDTYTGSVGLKANNWYHIAIVRSATSTMAIYLNGVAQSLSAGSSNSLNYTMDLVQVGGYSGGLYLNGYMSDVRLVKGSAVYTSNFTPPTAPLTAVANTSLLCNMQNGAIYDNAMMNDLETVGNAQISTSVVKYGTGSLAFDGTGDYLAVRASPNFAFGTGDFTIECWIYVSSNPAQYTCIMSNWSGSDPAWLLDFSNGSGNIRFNDSGAAYLTSSSALPTGQWNHVAVSRSGTSLKMFFNGSTVASTTNSTSFGSASSGVFIGAYYNNTYPLNGYIDDLRITKGFARYTTTFTPPTAALPDKGPI